jgi:hypothetical protein
VEVEDETGKVGAGRDVVRWGGKAVEADGIEEVEGDGGGGGVIAESKR